MLGRRDPQATIFDGDQVYLDHVGRGSFYSYLAQERHQLFRDEDFVELYSANRGRPSVPPSTLCVALVLQQYDGCSDKEAADRAAYDQRWKVALGSGELERPFVKSTLQLFRAQLLLHDVVRAPFEASLQAARRVGRLKSDGRMRAALDTTAILGRGAVRDTYNLLGDGILNVIRELAKRSRQPLQDWAEKRGLGRYLGASLKGEAAIDWDEPEARLQLLRELVSDAERVLKLARRARASSRPQSQQEERLLKASELLSQVLLQDVEPDEGGKPRIRQETRADRLCSIHDPEMRHGRKSKATRFDGHKLALAADVESQLVVAVEVLPGNTKDDEGSLELAQQAERSTGLKLEVALGDCAYGSGHNRQRFAEAGVPLLAKVAAQRDTGYFGKDDFEINLEAMSCCCPAGQLTTNLVRSGTTQSGGRRVPVRAFSFAAATCASCPMRAACYRPGRLGRKVQLNPHEPLLQAAKRWQRSPEFAMFRKERQVVEHRIGRLLQLGVRQARYFGRHKTLFQVLMAATVANLTLVASGAPTGMRLPNLGRRLLQLIHSPGSLIRGFIGSDQIQGQIWAAVA